MSDGAIPLFYRQILSNLCFKCVKKSSITWLCDMDGVCVCVLMGGGGGGGGLIHDKLNESMIKGIYIYQKNKITLI